MTKSFELAEHVFEANGHRFSVSLAKDVRPEPDITIASLLGGTRTEVRDDLSDRLLAALTRKPQKLVDLAEAVGRKGKDGTVRRALEGLEAAGEAERVGRGLWKLPGGGSLTLIDGDGGVA